MATSASWLNEPNPAQWLPTGAGNIGQPYLRGANIGGFLEP